MKAKQYGVLAVTGIAGMPPDCDEAHFDGWSAYRRAAEEVFRLFKK